MLCSCLFSASVPYVLRRQRRHPKPAGSSPVTSHLFDLLLYVLRPVLFLSPCSLLILFHICNDCPPLAYMLFTFYLSFPPSVLSVCSAGSLRRPDQRGADHYRTSSGPYLSPVHAPPMLAASDTCPPVFSKYAFYESAFAGRGAPGSFSDPGAPLPTYLFLSP